jgi:hypothetical protein
MQSPEDDFQQQSEFSRMNLLIRDLFGSRNYGDAIRTLQTEFARESLELAQAEEVTIQRDYEIDDNWYLVTSVPIVGVFSESAESDANAPPNSFAVYPYLLQLDSMASSAGSTEGGCVRGAPVTTSSGAPVGLGSCPATQHVPSPVTCGHSILKTRPLYKGGQTHLSFSAAITSVTHLYNFAMAHICLSTTTSVPTVHLEAACRAIRWITKLLRCLWIDVLEGSKLGKMSMELSLYRLAIINQLRLPALNNLAYVYSSWGQQAFVNECLELLSIDLQIRKKLAIDLLKSHQRSVANVETIFMNISERKLRGNSVQGGESVDYLMEGVHDIEPEEGDGEYHIQVTAMLQALLAQLTGRCENDGMLTVYLNVQYLNPGGSTPVSGASVA